MTATREVHVSYFSHTPNFLSRILSRSPAFCSLSDDIAVWFHRRNGNCGGNSAVYLFLLTLFTTSGVTFYPSFFLMASISFISRLIVSVIGLDLRVLEETERLRTSQRKLGDTCSRAYFYNFLYNVPSTYMSSYVSRILRHFNDTA